MIAPRDSAWVLPPESEVLLLAAHRILPAQALARIGGLVNGSFDWDRCRALARYHGITPLIVRALSPGGARVVPSEVWNQLIADQRALTIHNLSATAELLAVAEDLDEAGVDALAVKGPVAGITLYGDVSLRPFLDLDLLIAPEDRDRAIECLDARGYRPSVTLDSVGWRRYFRRYIEMSWIHPRTGSAVDLHWALLEPRYRYSAVLAGCYERATVLPIGARRIRTLCPEDMLVYSLMHAAKHQWRELRFLVDAALLIEIRHDLGWAAIALALGRARASRRAIAVGLRLVELLFDVPVNPLVAGWIAGDDRVDALAREAAYSLTNPAAIPSPGAPWPWRQRFHRSMSRRDRLRDTYERMLTPTPLEWAMIPLPDWLGWAYPAVRIARLIDKHVWRAPVRPPPVVDA